MYLCKIYVSTIQKVECMKLSFQIINKMAGIEAISGRQTKLLVRMEFGLKIHYLAAQSRPHSTVYRGLIVTLRAVLEPITSGC